eukprot:GHVL01024220.1.p1 GENE.GHVL01024220.1~~GHVL01024220.1.p1  ORF type:complete len:353 (+),score=58.65 GHVL01024220.1:97-1155(+)
MAKIALITGITGQDGSYLAEFLLAKNYEVHGIVRRSSLFNTERIDDIFDKVKLHYGDILDGSNLCRIIASVKPDEIYNLAAQSHVKVSFDIPEYTAESAGLGVLRVLEAIKICQLKTRLFQASTSEMFGWAKEVPQTETTPFYPRSPYAISKLFSYWLVKNYREAYEMYCANGIMFNHESPRRGRTFVTRKITHGIAEICAKKRSIISLGNLEALRDWGHAADYVKAMWLMLQQQEPGDFVICSGEQHSVREFTGLSFAMVGKPIRWKGSGVDEQGILLENEEVVVDVNPTYYRPTEVNSLLGCANKAKRDLGWTPSVSFYELIYDMLKHDMASMNLKMDTYSLCLERIKNI